MARQLTPVSIRKQKGQGGFISPTIGRKFLIDNHFTGQVNSLEVYDVTGLRVELIKGSNLTGWSADFMPAGLYVIIAKTKEGQMNSQKVMVK